MQLAIITVRREPSYFERTVEDLKRSTGWTQLDVFVDGQDFDYAARAVPGRVVVMAAEDLTRRETLTQYQRAANNFLRALDDNHERDVTLFEDDITIKRGWLDALDEAREAHPEALVTLYTHPSIADHLRGLHHGFYVIPWDVFYGTLALYVPRVLRKELADYTRARYDKLDRRWPFDECVRYFAKEHGVPIVATVPSWVDHIGVVPAIEENRKHGPRRSPMF